MLLPEFLTRRALTPTLRMVRSRLAANPDYREVRKWAARADSAYPKTPAHARVSEVAIGDVKATWIDAKGARKDRAILYLHGGAFIAETPAVHGAFVARLGAQARVRALMPNYRLAPEFPCPAALDDCMAAYRFLLADGFAAQDIVVVGDSAGGNLTLGLLLRARDEGLPLPAGAVVLSAATDGTLSGDSMRRNAEHDDMFAPSLFHALGPLYLRDETLRTHPHVSPLHGDLHGLPPILMLVGSTELLLDDSVRFASKCPSATLQVWHGMPHVFPIFDFLPEAAQATQRIARFVRERLAAAGSHSVATARDGPSAALDSAAGDEESTFARPSELQAQRLLGGMALAPRARLYLAAAIVGSFLVGVLCGLAVGA
jgi:epsilon-lactone hydrolase